MKCGIHGESCEGDDEDNTCCGDMKYFCQVVGDLEGLRCCIPWGGKGCSYDRHCCGYVSIGSPDDGDCTEAESICCDALESRCVAYDGSYPTDAVGLPDVSANRVDDVASAASSACCCNYLDSHSDVLPVLQCSNKGGECETVADCCGSTRLLCEVNPAGDPPKVCCVDTEITGCDSDDDCCSGTCNIDTSTCCIATGKNCTTHGECCLFYCNDGTCDVLPV